MRCHTWPPAASAPHMGVTATMNGPPSPAPGWHILIHERAWALSGQNYPYQNATINTFINPTSVSALFSFSSTTKKKTTPLQKSTRLPCLCSACACPLTPLTFAHNHTSKHLTCTCMFSLITSYCSQKWYACLSLVGVRPPAPNGSLSDELSVPQVLASLSSDLLTQNNPNVNRSSQLITKPENEICVTCTTESKQGERGRLLTHSKRWNTFSHWVEVCMRQVNSQSWEY